MEGRGNERENRRSEGHQLFKEILLLSQSESEGGKGIETVITATREAGKIRAAKGVIFLISSLMLRLPSEVKF